MHNSESDEEISAVQHPARAANGSGKRKPTVSSFRSFFSSKFRKVRDYMITGNEIQRFCHESHWGGRINT